jgi:hypothetical protein
MHDGMMVPGVVTSESDSKMQPMESALYAKLVMLGLVPGIHALLPSSKKDVDGRDEARP